MKNKFVPFGLVALLVLIPVFNMGAQATVPSSDRVRTIVAFSGGVSEQSRKALLNKHGASVIRELPIIDGVAVLLPWPAIKALGAESGVRLVEVDQEVFAFPKPPSEPPPQQLPTGVDRIDGENLTNKGTGVKVAVIDSGVDYKHPDLDGNFDPNLLGYDFVNDDADPMDDNGHGTHVAGILAAEENTIGVVGVSPEAKLYAVKVLNRQGKGLISDIVAGIGWSVDNGMQVANLSLGAKLTSDALQTAVVNATTAGVTLVVAAGNDADDTSLYIPARYPEVITVSAIADFDGRPGGLAPSRYFGKGAFKVEQKDDAFAYFSNYGPPVDLAAPGVSIYSTWTGGTYKTLSGTSMAAPHVAGAAALYIKTNSGSTPEQVRLALQSAGWHYSDGLGGGYFLGDPDTEHEPLLRASGL